MINRLCRLVFLKLLGWRQIGEVPKEKKYLFVAIPHTSNWDFVFGWMAIRALELDVTIFVKDAYFIWPLNHICRFFGVAPVNRRERTDFVNAIAQQFENADSLAALITPEGTRKYIPDLKSGYYYLAKKARVPIVVAGPNYAQKTFSILPARKPLDSFAEDAENLLEFCRKMKAKHPENTFQ